MKVHPLYDRILVERNDAPEKTKGGLYLPSSSSEKPSQGTVLAVGDGHLKESGKIKPLQVKSGDTVVFGKYAGTEIKIEGKDFLIMKEEDILGILENK